MAKTKCAMVEHLARTMMPVENWPLLFCWVLNEPIEEQLEKFEEKLDEVIAWVTQRPNRSVTMRHINFNDTYRKPAPERDAGVCEIEQRIALKHSLSVDALRAYYA